MPISMAASFKRNRVSRLSVPSRTMSASRRMYVPRNGLDPHVRVHPAQPFRRGFGFRLVHVRLRIQGLPLEVHEFHDVSVDEAHMADPGPYQEVRRDTSEGTETHNHCICPTEGLLTLHADFGEHRLATIAVGTGHGRLREGRFMPFVQSLVGRHDGNTNDSRSPERTSATSLRTSSPRAARTIRPAIVCISSSVAPILVTSLVPMRPTASTMRLFASSRSANWAWVRPHESLRAIGST